MLKQERLSGTERPRQMTACAGVVDDAGVVVEDRVVLVEGACVLAQRLEESTGCGPRASVDRVRVGGGDDVWAGTMDF